MQTRIVNAWNEWGEGNVLEPDLHSGSSYLKELQRALQTHKRNDEYKKRVSSMNLPLILFVSHQGGGGVERYMKELP